MRQLHILDLVLAAMPMPSGQHEELPSLEAANLSTPANSHMQVTKAQEAAIKKASAVRRGLESMQAVVAVCGCSKA